MMEKTKLTVRVARALLENAPIVRRLSGTLPAQLTIQDYQKHLEEKYGQS